MASPAFQFYAQDFLVGTADMSPDEVGGYIRLLCIQWAKGVVPDDAKKLRQLTGCSNRAIKTIVAKFEKHNDGLKNARLEAVRADRNAFVQQRSEAGKRSAKIRAKSQHPFNERANDRSTSVATGSQREGQREGNSSVFSLQSSGNTDRQTDTRGRGEPTGEGPDRSVLIDGFARLMNRPQTAISWGPIVNWLATVEGDGQTALAWECLKNALETSTAAPHTSQAAVKYVSAIYERCRHHECKPGEFPKADSGGGAGSLETRAQANLSKLLAEMASEK